MSLTDFAFWFIVGLLVFWLFGGFLARLGGVILVLAGGAGLVINPQAGALLVLAMGALTWLLGHWHYAVRHHGYKSPLARYVFCRWAPAWGDLNRD